MGKALLTIGLAVVQGTAAGLFLGLTGATILARTIQHRMEKKYVGQHRH